jgi:hypothetical protein
MRNIPYLELSVISDLIVAKKLYLSMNFIITHSEDIGNGCILQHMILKL